MLVRRGRRSALFTFVAVHSTRRGPAVGGCRMWTYEDSRAALSDVLRLSRAMTHKAAAADLRLGGGKGVIMLSPGVRVSSRRRHEALLDFAESVEALDGRYITAEDVGTSIRDMTLIAQHTRFVAGLPRRLGGSGDPSALTALGVEYAIRASIQHVFGDPSLRGRTVCVVGLGHVGSRLARRLARAGTGLLVSDLDPAKRRLADRLGATWIAPARALAASVDVLAPCALGGVLNQDTVPRLRCRIVAGAANNQLAQENVADLIARRGVLWAPDFVVNAGGLINIAEELGGYEPASARRRVQQIAGTLSHIFQEADRLGTTPLSTAMALARTRLGA